MSIRLDLHLPLTTHYTRQIMQLTKAEEQIMQILWSLEEGTVQDILKGFEKDVPARTTVATVLKILEDKDFVTHRNEGRINVYRALVEKDKYSKRQLSTFIKDYFNGSFSSMVSFFAKESDISIEDMDKILEETRKNMDSE